ncbi:MAG: contractile injection system protein, VgrG/Pvc8 family [Gallionella sp.]|nr:contractile injection system protein, VgrG/Pvc8 family [Gallionella sp.]
MQTDRVTLLIAGKEHSYWERYEIDSDLMIPADAWSVSLGLSGGQMPPGVMEGASVVVKVGNDTVLTGYVDEISHSVNKTTHTLTMSGRDLAADLLDCSAPIITRAQLSLKEIVAAILGEFKKTKIRIDADLTYARKKISTQPGDTAWDALANAAESNGLWSWFEPDGTLVVGGPDYSSPIVATLILRRDGKGNNVISLDKTSSHVCRYSRVTVLGQTPGTESEQGKPDLHASWKDSGVLRHRPKIVFDHEAENNGMCSASAKKLIGDSRLRGLTLTATVQGHRIVAPGQPFDKTLWLPGQRIRVISEPHGIDGVYFLMARKFIRSRMDGTRTVLTLKEDGVWLAGAHPHKKHKRGKNAAPLQIITA